MGRVNTEEIIPAKDPLKLKSRRVVLWREGSIHKDKGRFTRLEFGKWRDLDKSSKLWSPHWLPIGHVVNYFFLFLVFFHVGLFSSEVPIPINRIREIWGFIFNQSLGSVFWVLLSFLSRLWEHELRVKLAHMVSDDLRELKKVRHRHEEINQANNSTILVLSSKVEELEQSITTQSANFVNSSSHWKITR